MLTITIFMDWALLTLEVYGNSHFKKKVAMIIQSNKYWWTLSLTRPS